MKRIGFYKKSMLRLAFSIVLIIGFFVFLLTTTPGLHTSIWLVAQMIPGKLKIQQLEGRVIDRFSAKTIIYVNKNNTVKIQQFSLNWQPHFTKPNHLFQGVFKAKKIVVNHIDIVDLKGDFSGNTLKSALINAQFNGEYNDISLKGKLKYQRKLDMQIKSGANALTITGQPPFTWTAKATIKEPAQLDPALQGLHATLTAQANLRDMQHGNFKLTLEKGYLNTRAIPNLTFMGAELKAQLKPNGLETKGLFSLDKDKRMALSIFMPQFKRWEGSGVIEVADQKLQLKGQGHIKPHITGTINLIGDTFPLLDTNEYTIFISPKLQTTFSTKSWDVKGEILVPKAQITPISFDNGLVLSDDVTFVSPKTQPLPFNINCNITLLMGDAVLLNIKGLNALLNGSITLNKANQGPITATGQLGLKDGKYKAYGQDLAIEQGQLLFTGGLVTNPGIQLRAARTFTNTTFGDSDQRLDFKTNNRIGNKTTVGVEVSGWLDAPKVELFANPATLSQADILSMLILGHPASEASKSGGQLLLAAVSSMNLGTGTKGAQLLEQVKNSLGLDFNVKTTTTYNQSTNTAKDSTGIVIGKSLTKRLYVSYNRGFAQADANVLTLKYLLNKFLSVQVTASDTAGNGIDLLYSSKKDETHEK